MIIVGTQKIRSKINPLRVVSKTPGQRVTQNQEDIELGLIYARLPEDD